MKVAPCAGAPVESTTGYGLAPSDATVAANGPCEVGALPASHELAVKTAAPAVFCPRPASGSLPPAAFAISTLRTARLTAAAAQHCRHLYQLVGYETAPEPWAAVQAG